MQRGHDIDPCRQTVRGDRLGHRQVLERHAGKVQPRGQRFRFFDQLFARLDAIDARARRPAFAPLEEQVVQDEAQIGLARAMIHQLDVRLVGQHLLQQRLDELDQVIDLLELAPAVLVELAVSGQDMQFLEQFERLPGPDLVGQRVGRLLLVLRRIVRWFLHSSMFQCSGPPSPWCSSNCSSRSSRTWSGRLGYLSASAIAWYSRAASRRSAGTG